MLAAYARNDRLQEARRVFDSAPEKTIVSWNAMLTAYAREGHLAEAQRVFEEMPQRNLISWNALLIPRVVSLDHHCAWEIYHRFPEWNIVSSTAMLAAFARNGCLQEAKSLFETMMETDLITYSLLLHANLKGARLEDAERILETMPEQDIASWTSMLTARMASLRNANACLMGFRSETWSAGTPYWLHILRTTSRMKPCSCSNRCLNTILDSILPDAVCFVLILIVCSYAGKLEAGRQYFKTMSEDFGIKPLRQHYGCIIDLISRKGGVEEAWKLINSMPCKAMVLPGGWLILVPDASSMFDSQGYCSWRAWGRQEGGRMGLKFQLISRTGSMLVSETSIPSSKYGEFSIDTGPKMNLHSPLPSPHSSGDSSFYLGLPTTDSGFVMSCEMRRGGGGGRVRGYSLQEHLFFLYLGLILPKGNCPAFHQVHFLR